VNAVPATSVVLVEDSVPYARLIELILADALPGGVQTRHFDTVGAAVRDLRARPTACCWTSACPTPTGWRR
jgi:hypothetical protein